MEIGVGLLGWGTMGAAHAAAWKSLRVSHGGEPVSIRLVGVADPDESRARAGAAEGGFEWFRQDPDDVIDHPDVSVVDICSPTPAHADAVRSTTAAGKHTLCETPFITSAREAEEVSALAGRTPGKKQMASPGRFLPEVIEAKGIIEAGLIGDLVRLSGVCGRARLSWLDLARYLAGEISAVMVDGEDGQMRFANGANGMLAMDSTAGAQETVAMEITGTSGAMKLSVFPASRLTISGIPSEVTAGDGESPSGLAASIAAFARAVVEDGPVSPSFFDGLMALRLNEAVRESARTGTWESVDCSR